MLWLGFRSEERRVGKEWQKLQPSIEIDAYGIEGGPIYLNAMVGFYLNEH